MGHEWPSSPLFLLLGFRIGLAKFRRFFVQLFDPIFAEVLPDERGHFVTETVDPGFGGLVLASLCGIHRWDTHCGEAIKERLGILQLAESRQSRLLFFPVALFGCRPDQSNLRVTNGDRVDELPLKHLHVGFSGESDGVIGNFESHVGGNSGDEGNSRQ